MRYSEPDTQLGIILGTGAAAQPKQLLCWEQAAMVWGVAVRRQPAFH